MPVGLPLAANLFKVAVMTFAVAFQTAPILTGSTTGGTLAAATYFIRITAIVGGLETAPSPEASVVTTGATSSIAITVPQPVAGATAYRAYVGTVAGSQAAYIVIAPPALSGTYIGSGTTAGTAPVVTTFAPVSLMNSFDISAAENVATFDVFDSDDPIEFAGKQRRTLSVSGYLADSTDTGQALIFFASANKLLVTLRMLWDGTTNGFTQQCRVNAYKGSAKAGNNPIDVSFDFYPGTAAGTLVGTGPLL